MTKCSFCYSFSLFKKLLLLFKICSEFYASSNFRLFLQFIFILNCFIRMMTVDILNRTHYLVVIDQFSHRWHSDESIDHRLICQDVNKWPIKSRNFHFLHLKLIVRQACLTNLWFIRIWISTAQFLRHTSTYNVGPTS